MSILDGFKTCRKGLHQYPADKRRCPECNKAGMKRWYQENRNQHLKNVQRGKSENLDHARENSRRWREKNPERVKENNQRWYEKNSEGKKKIERLRYEKNLERRRESVRRWQKKNPDRYRERLYNWKKQNLDKNRLYNSRRRANKKNATPPWVNHDAIKEVYAEAIRLEQKTGIKHHVDHIYPLQSDYMCGLHIAENLQIIPSKENLSKSNRTWPGQLDCQRLPLHMNGFKVAN